MKSEKTNKLALGVEKRSSIKTKRGIKICRHGFVEKLWQQSGQTGQTSEKLVERLLTCSLKRAYNSPKFDFREKRKMYFLRRLASNEIKTPKCPVSSILIDTREGSAFSNNRTLTGNM